MYEVDVMQMAALRFQFVGAPCHATFGDAKSLFTMEMFKAHAFISKDDL